MTCLASCRRRTQRCRFNIAARLSLALLMTVAFAAIHQNGLHSHLFTASLSSYFTQGHSGNSAFSIFSAGFGLAKIAPRSSDALARIDAAASGASRPSHASVTAVAAAPTPATSAVGVPQRWFPDFARSAGVRCARILNGKRHETSKAAEFVRKNRHQFVCTAGDRALSEVTCDELRSAGYAAVSSTAEGATFPLAFGLRMHTCAVQAELLLRSIYEPQNVYCVHVDAKAGDDVIAAMRRVASCLPNVYLAPSDEDFVYASVSQLRADLTCMRLLLAAPATPAWRYFLNMAGQELPLLTNRELVALLRSYNGSNNIKSTLQPRYRYRYYFRFWCTDAYTNRTRPCDLPRAVKKPPPGRVQVYKGLAYGFFSRAFVEYLLDPRGRAARLYDWFKDTYAPEEHFFATVARLKDAPGGYDDDGRGGVVDAADVEAEPAGAAGGVEAAKFSSPLQLQQEQEQQQRLPTSRAVAWLGGRKRCKGRYVRQVCVYGVGDTPWLLAQPQAIANKFRYDFDPLALQCMAERVINRTLAERAGAATDRARSEAGARASSETKPNRGAEEAAADFIPVAMSEPGPRHGSHLHAAVT